MGGKTKTQCLAQCVEAYEKHGGNIIAVEEVPPEETHQYGVVAVGKDDGRDFRDHRHGREAGQGNGAVQSHHLRPLHSAARDLRHSRKGREGRGRRNPAHRRHEDRSPTRRASTACASTGAPTIAARRSASWPPISRSRWSGRNSPRLCASRPASSASNSAGRRQRSSRPRPPRRRGARQASTSSPASSPATKAAAKASPAPVVSIACAAGASAVQRAAPENASAPAAPRLMTTSGYFAVSRSRCSSGIVGSRQRRGFIGVGEQHRGAGGPWPESSPRPIARSGAAEPGSTLTGISLARRSRSRTAARATGCWNV